MTVHSLAEYQRAKAYLSEIEKILKTLTATEISLKKHKHFRSVQNILTTIYNEKVLLELHLEKYKMIVQTKGQKGF